MYRVMMWRMMTWRMRMVRMMMSSGRKRMMLRMIDVEEGGGR
jgi:hypothetical protein